VALQALGEIVGIVTNEDILDQIFKEFCIGK
jgi:tRNA U34 5-carboxymethylaminomethyl modifying GTPase MnmE/TrmE